MQRGGGMLTVSIAAVIATLTCGGSDGGPTDIEPNAQTPPASAGHSMVYADGLEMVLLVNAGLGGMSPL